MRVMIVGLLVSSSALGGYVWEFNEPAGTGLAQVANSGPRSVDWSREIDGVVTNGHGGLEVTSSIADYSFVLTGSLASEPNFLTAEVTIDPHQPASGKLLLGFVWHIDDGTILYSALWYERLTGFFGYAEGVAGGGTSVRILHDFDVITEPLILRIEYDPDSSAELLYGFQSDLGLIGVGVVPVGGFYRYGVPGIYLGVEEFRRDSFDQYFTLQRIEIVPEPSQLWLLGLGLILIPLGHKITVRRRRTVFFSFRPKSASMRYWL